MSFIQSLLQPRCRGIAKSEGMEKKTYQVYANLYLTSNKDITSVTLSNQLAFYDKGLNRPQINDLDARRLNRHVHPTPEMQSIDMLCIKVAA